MRTFAILNMKGGVGKTTTAINAANSIIIPVLPDAFSAAARDYRAWVKELVEKEGMGDGR